MGGVIVKRGGGGQNDDEALNLRTNKQMVCSVH